MRRVLVPTRRRDVRGGEVGERLWLVAGDATAMITNCASIFCNPSFKMNELQSIILAAWGGYEYESEHCTRPCTLISVDAKFLQSGTGGATNYISIDFAPFVQLEYIVLQYDLPQLVVEIGSCLGLWLGLSLVGMFDLLTAVAEKLVKRIQQAKKASGSFCT